jgi:AcrR family transcriptional regulator
VKNGFHATTVDHIAEEAGYSKGAVYSNFDSKEELFLAVYEERVARGVAQVEAAIRELGVLGGLSRVTTARAKRDRKDELWVALLMEFWAHVVRNPAARARFVKLHERALAPIAKAIAALSEEGVALPLPADRFARAMNGMQIFIVLERLVHPGAFAVEDGDVLARALFEALKTRKGGLP